MVVVLALWLALLATLVGVLWLARRANRCAASRGLESRLDPFQSRLARLWWPEIVTWPG